MAEEKHAGTAHPTHSGYRSDIDGLRAVAVLSVVGYHAFPDVVRGGFVGVDVFFVISGFLISGIILDGLARGEFSFRGFYARRIKRIFPALIVVLAACWTFGWLFLLPDEFGQLGRHIVAGAGFASNFVLWSESGYFDKAAELKPLLHLWSLGIEEQFYIAWPLLLFLGWKRRVDLLKVTLALLLGSFLLNLHLTGSDRVAAFYSPVARFWELLAGGALAHVAVSRKRSSGTQLGTAVRSGQSLLGIALIGLAVLLLDESRQFPGWQALLPVSGAFLLLAAGPAAWFNRAVLSSGPLVLVGLISYPLYLWHWPLLAFARIVGSGEPPVPVRVAMIGASLVLAYLTYRFIERPIRFSHPVRKMVPALSVGMLAAALGGVASVGRDGMPDRFSEEVQPYVTYRYDFKLDSRAGSCWLGAAVAPDGYADECIDGPAAGKPLAVVWGDSHAARFFPGLRAAIQDRSRLAQLTRDACPPVLEYGYENCVNANRFVAGKIETLRPQTVILFAVWNQYSRDGQDDVLFRQLAVTIRRLKETGIERIIVIGPAPQWTDSLPGHLARQAIHGGSGSIPARTYEKFDPAARKADAMLRKRIEASPDALYFSALDAMCDPTGCLTTVNGRADGLTTWDYGHLTTEGALYLARKLGASAGGLGPATIAKGELAERSNAADLKSVSP